jgi:hypothetical protein
MAGQAFASTDQILLSASGMVPFHFLSKEDIGHALGRHFFVRRCGLLAHDEGQARFRVASEPLRDQPSSS